jgi:hypothetical protein
VYDDGGDDKGYEDPLDAVRPARYCSPRHRMPFNSIHDDAKCISSAWQASA